jgi:Zn-dependent protease with chaperone function
MAVPFLGSAYARACEYTCDAMAAHCRPDGAADGLRVLAAGRHLYPDVDVTELTRQAEEDGDFWAWMAEMLSGRPFLSKRLAALPEMARTAGARRPHEPAAAPATGKGGLAAAPA